MNELHASEVEAIKRELLSSLHCALPGTVESFDADTRTAVIRPAVPGMPLLRDVPVFMPVSFEVNPGDACLVIFADRDIDRWLAGEEGTGSARMHSLSDGFAFIGFRTCHSDQAQCAEESLRRSDDPEVLR